MNSISSYSPSLSASPGFQEAYQSYSELQAARLSVSESRSKDITIFTDEGDRVTAWGRINRTEFEINFPTLSAIKDGGR